MMKQTKRSSTLAAGALLLAAGVLAAPARAQEGALAFNATYETSSRSDDEALRLSGALQRGGYAVVVDLDENRLSFRQGELVLWSAPIGTGTGLRLETEENEWDFSTPRGVYHVQYKEVNPVWIAPDWYFVENKLPIPPQNDKKRRFPGGLGAAAVYIGHDLAIHGTDKPELLGQRVSHGCIRLADKDAQRLFHNVQIGTEVVIVGGHDIEKETKAAKLGGASTFDPTKAKPRPKDPAIARWERASTEELLAEFEEELWADPDESRWPEIGSLLLDRALDGEDDLALRGLLLGSADLPSARLEREYRTFLADAFARGALRTLGALADLDRESRQRAAEEIVAASLDLYSGDLDSPSVPWPTTRVPRSAADGVARLGWNALSRAERDYRGEREWKSMD